MRQLLLGLLPAFLGLFLQGAGLAAAEPVGATKGQAVLLKLDDLGRSGAGDSLPYARWQRVVDFLAEQQVAVNVGVFLESVDGDFPKYHAWLKAQAATGRVEFWYHAWYNRFPDALKSATRTGEFQGATIAEQQALIARGWAVMAEKTGITMAAYGPHGAPLAGADATATYAALATVPAIKAVWFYPPSAGTTSTLTVIPRSCELEKPLFKPNAENVRQTFAAAATSGKVAVLAMQGHPGAWDDERFAEFTKAVLFLKEQGCRFMTVSAFLAEHPRTE